MNSHLMNKLFNIAKVKETKHAIVRAQMNDWEGGWVFSPRAHEAPYATVRARPLPSRLNSNKPRLFVT